MTRTAPARGRGGLLFRARAGIISPVKFQIWLEGTIHGCTAFGYETVCERGVCRLPRFAGTRAACAVFLPLGGKIGGKHERIPVQFLSRRAAGRRADAQILAAMHPVAARRRAVQHRRPALHRQRELPRLLRQRGQQRRVPADGHRARHRHHDRRRLLRLCQHPPRRGGAGAGAPQRRQRHRAHAHRQRCAHGGVPHFHGSDPDGVRRDGQRRDVRPLARILLLDRARHPVLHVRAGDEPHHSLRRQPALRHAVAAGGRGVQHHPRPHLHLPVRVGHDGRGRCNGHRPDPLGCAGGGVSAAHEGRAAAARQLPAAG